MAISEGIKRASGNGVAAVASGGLLGISGSTQAATGTSAPERGGWHTNGLEDGPQGIIRYVTTSVGFPGIE